jgi:general secretion pathway protein G
VNPHNNTLPLKAAGGRRAAVGRLHVGHAFTLVELLAVFAVVAILAALLLPVLGRMRESGNQAKCASNLRSLGGAAQLYVADHDGALPISAGRTDAPDFAWSNDWWMEEISPYLDEGMRWPPPQPNEIGRTPFACPSGEPPDRWGGHYGMNSLIVPFTKPSEPQKRAVGLPTPSSTLLFADSLSVYINQEFITKGANATHGSLKFRHGDTANVVYVDGHVGSVTKQQCEDAAFRKTLMGQE